MDLTKTQLVLDVWEGQLEIDEAEFIRGGVKGLVIRLNSMNGGHHLDANFLTQWAQSSNFVRIPYFVYNPWVSGTANYQWLLAYMPAGCPGFAADIEVRMPGLTPPAAYGVEVAQFISLCKARWKTIIYGGAGYLDMLTPWPTTVDYWWAQWPYSMYPSTVTTVTWDQLRTMIAALVWPPMNAAKCPGNIKMWQCSGDRLIVPGNSKVIDVNVFPGTIDELKTFFGYQTVTPVLTLEQRVAALEAQARIHGWSL